MRLTSMSPRLGFLLSAWGIGIGLIPLPVHVRAAMQSPGDGEAAAASPQQASPHREDSAAIKPPLDRSGRKRVGKASLYAKKFAGRRMADGQLMQPRGDNAASKTLPLGTTAKVTNLETGKSAVVTIQDRGPYVKGRIVDLSPATAQRLGIDPGSGVAKVAVTPITVPLADGTTKPGAAAKDAPDSPTPRR
jgi:rare lipoprotein A